MKTLFKNATIINEKHAYIGNVLVKDNKICRVRPGLNSIRAAKTYKVVDCEGKYLVPGVIDDHVHFREPGLTHKGDIASESAAAVAGGITSYMDMPNTNPQTTTLEALEDKFERAAHSSVANYSFYIGATNTNLDVIKNVDFGSVCGVKLFMGSSTGNMLVDNIQVLDDLFAFRPPLIAAHCENEDTIRRNTEQARIAYGDTPPWDIHPAIRSTEACYLSAAQAAVLARTHKTRLHLLHLSTEQEIDLLDIGLLKNRLVTGEACVNHLWFSDADYSRLGSHIKINPSIKSEADRRALLGAVAEGVISVVGTDHAPHTLAEKEGTYFNVPSGAPMVQHSLVAMLELAIQNKLRYTTVIERMCHAPADLFGIEKRGYIRKGYFADLVIVEPTEWTVAPENILSKCGWSPLTGTKFHHRIAATYVNGKLVYDGEKVDKDVIGEKLAFKR